MAAILALTTIQAQIPGRNVNMVAGSTWPDGDPFLQRQNEPSIAASTRNPMHLLGGANDYRTVDLPGLDGDEIGDAWLGLFKSFDGGQRWKSTLLPGYPQDTSTIGRTSPIHGYGAAADPVVRAGTSGMMYYAGLVFDRANPATPEVPGKSAIFVARFVDNNNQEAGDTFHYLGTRVLQNEKGGKQGDFLDKPWMAVDIPRDNARCTIVTPGEKGPITQSIPAGPVYVAYTLRSTDNKGTRYDVMFTKSSDCGATFKPPIKLNNENDRANQGATIAVEPKTGNVVVAWRRFDVSEGGNGDAVMTTKYTLSTDKFSTPGIARRYPKGKKKGLNVTKFFQRGGVNEALAAVDLASFDQSTSDIHNLLAFRTNAYPTMAADENGRFYMAWAERGFDPLSQDPVNGDARVLVSTSTDGSAWTAPKAVSVEQQRGHQLMPSLTYAGGKLMLIFYDLRETSAQVFSKYIDDRTAFATQTAEQRSRKRHTMDLRAVMAAPGAIPEWGPSVRVSDYLMGAPDGGGAKQQLQINPPNLPMFKLGTAPFMGDYVDVAPAPTMVQNAAGKWIYNTAAGSSPPVFHAVWTDNRDVRPPTSDANLDGNPWNDYTPPTFTGFSPMDPSRTVPQCLAGNAGSRNQNIYTARITGGLIVGSPGNTKQLGYRLDENGSPTSQLMQRSFVVFVQNTTNDPLVRTRTFRLTITNQPPGGKASFDQFALAPLTVIEAEVPNLSTASRTVYVTSTNPDAKIDVSVVELTAQGGVVKSDGLTAAVVLNPDIDNPDIDNPDIDNPDIDNPDIDNPDIDNPDIDNAEVSNPDIDNPDIDNPDIDNPDIDNPDIDNPDIDNIVVANPDIDNPDIDNPDIDNPDIDNPDIDNPDIDNPDIDNASLTDVSWAITNRGNTTAAYNVNLFFAQTTVKPGLETQLILSRTYKTPVVQDCALKSETRNVLVANVPDPHLVKASTGTVSDPNDPDPENATLWLAPGESAKITLRIFDPNELDNITVTNEDGTTATIDTAFVPNEDVTPVVQQQSVDTEDVDEGVTEPEIVVQFPAPQAAPDDAFTAENTPVKLNPLANDSTAFGSTKIISWHPDGMASHSGSMPGPDMTFQPSTGFVYTARAAIDPETDALVGRFPLVPTGATTAGPVSLLSNPRTGINYARTAAPNTTGVGAFDTRPDSATFHQFLPMPVITNSALAMTLDATHGRLYVAHGPLNYTAATPTTVSVIDVVPGSPSFHTIIKTVALPLSLRTRSIEVNSRTQMVYVATTSASGIGGVYVFDGTAGAPVAARVTSTYFSWSLAINEAANLVFATSSVGEPAELQLFAIDGATNALTTTVLAGLPMRFDPAEERMVVHEASGKVFIRLESKVAIFDGQRGSPTFNTFLGTVDVGRETGVTDIAVDQELGLVVTVGNADFQVDIIDVATNAITETIPMNGPPSDVAIDPLAHRAFASTSLTYVQEIDLLQEEATAAIPVFVESGGVLLNPLGNKAYIGLFTTRAQLVQVSGSGLEGPIGDPQLRLPIAGRFLFGAWHDDTNKGFIVNGGNPSGTGIDPGSVIVVDGATHTVQMLGEVLPNPFGIGIDQVDDRIFVATLSALGAHGGVLTANANDLDEDPVVAQGANGQPLPAGFNLNAPDALLAFGRYVVVNPATHNVYVTQIGGSPVSLAVLDPATNQLTPLDGQAGTPVFDHLNSSACGGDGQPACATFGRAVVVRVDESLNRIFVGYQKGTAYEIVVLDGLSHSVIGTLTAGGHSNRHTPSYLVLNEAADEFYVSDYANNTVRKFNSATLAPIGAAVSVPGGPSAMAHNIGANRIYISSVDSKSLTAIDVSTMEILSTVQLPLVGYFLAVDEDESRIYTSGGDAMDESGTMVVTDVLGKLGTNVSITSVGSPLKNKGTVVLNSDNSVTYTPFPGMEGDDQFTYNIAAPTGTAIGTVTINIVPSAPAILAFSDVYQAASGVALNVAAPGPMANDAAVGAFNVTVLPSHGVLTFQADGQFTYTPNPQHPGSDSFIYRVDTVAGPSNAVTVRITVAAPANNPLIVVNTADSGPGSLRNALTYANATAGAQTITFNIPGATPASWAVISLQSPLPVITQPVNINGLSQVSQDGLPLVELTAGAFIPNGLETGTDVVGVTIQGLMITRFSNAGIMLMQSENSPTGNLVSLNIIGTDRLGQAGRGNATGIVVRSDFSTIGNNVISGNTGVGLRLENDADNVTIQSNTIGLALGVARPNGTDGVKMFGSLNNNKLDNNVIAGNGGWGVNLDDLANDHVTGTQFYGNRIGVDAGGNAFGNFLGGIRLNNAGSTQVGLPAQARNVISSNGGPNPQDIGPGILVLATSVGTVPAIRNNYIGLDTTGQFARGNRNKGIQLDGPAFVGGPNANEGNYISGQPDAGGAGIIVGLNAGGSTIRGNVIGLNVNNQPVANAFSGITVRATSAVTIGGNIAAEGNIISGNGQAGIAVMRVIGNDPFPSGTIIRGNRIGTNKTETLDLGNGGPGIIAAGVNLQIGGAGVGEGNVIWYNDAEGIRVDASVTGVRVERNSLWGNSGLGIDLLPAGNNANDQGDGDTGANNLQNYPVLSGATSGTPTRVTFDTTSFAPGTYQLNFYVTNACGSGTGKTWEGSTTTGQNIVGTFNLASPVPSGYFITATATDASGNTSEFSPCAEIDQQGVVTNENDSGAGSLRAAIDYSNNTANTQTITFAIPNRHASSPALIQVTQPLPALVQPVILDGASQPGYDGLPVVEIRDGNNVATGLWVAASNVTIRGVAVTSFNEGIIVNGGLSNVLIENNVIGSNRQYTAGIGNGQGIQMSASDSTIRNNAIVRNVEGLIVINGASNNVIANNGIGVSLDGMAVHGNSWNGVVLYNGANNNRFEANIVSGNQGFGIDMQHSGALAQVSGTQFWSNKVGIDALGNAAPNALGGMHVLNAPNTQIGGDAAKRNIISGNAGHGILIEGGNVQQVQVSYNYIGLGLNGAEDRGNAADGVHVGQGTDTMIFGNAISGNNGNGVHVSASPNAIDVYVRGNIIGLNAGGTAAVGNSGAGVQITGAAVEIGGASVADRNVISGNLRGVVFSNNGTRFDSYLRGNYIGTNLAGNAVLANAAGGVLVDAAPGTTIGGPSAGQRNYIVGSSSGVRVQGATQAIFSGLFSTVIQGNTIGIRPDAQPAGNTVGIEITTERTLIGGTSLNTADGNIIANSTGRGISITGEVTGNRIGANSIYGNATLGIDLNNDGPDANDPGDTDNGANGTPNYASIVSAVTNGGTTTVSFDPGQLRPGFEFLFEFYSSPTCHSTGFGEGQTFRGAAGGLGGGAIDSIDMGTAVPIGHFVTLTSTGLGPHTSEFSACVQVTGPSTISGTIQYSTTPLENVNMDLIPDSVNNPPAQSTGSGPGGQYAFNNVPNGTYWIKSYGPDSSYIGWSAVQVVVNNGNVTQNISLAKKMTLASPSHGATGITAMPNLTWNSLPEAAKYVIQINNNTTWQQIDPGAESLTTSYQVQTLLTGSQMYTWQVDAYDSGNRHVGTTDMAFQFTVIAPIVVNVAGTSGGLDNPNFTDAPPGTNGTAATLGAVLGSGKVWISASGGVTFFSGGGAVDPNGFVPNIGVGTFLANGEIIAKLVARVNGGPWAPIGTGPTEVTVVGSGVQLQLAVNDNDYRDNGGSWTVIIQQ